ncbi:MAG: BspA family leucine-rich repeat surface protein [Lachnospiraceae bacterium]|nr:BspA family leucine-rich repeat surface protein [Lachnospiraceae bacterium]
MKKRIMRIGTVMVLTLSLLGVLFVRMQGSAKAGTRCEIDPGLFKAAIINCVNAGNEIKEIKVSNKKVTGEEYNLSTDNKVVGVFNAGVFTICPKNTGDQIAFTGDCFGLLSQEDYYTPQGCSNALISLEKVDLSGIDFSQVTNMASFFSGCPRLYSIKMDLSNASLVTSYRYTFRDCIGLTSLEAGVINTTSVTDANSMLASTAIPSFSFANFSINSTTLTDMSQFFDGCHYLQSVDMSTVNYVSGDAVRKMNMMFQNCSSLSSITMGRLSLGKNCEAVALFMGCSGLTNVDMSAVTLTGFKSMKNWFTDCTSLRSINLSSLDTSTIQVMEGLFSGCTKLESVNLKNWNTAKVRSMACMFENCSSLVSADLSSFSCEKLTLSRPTNSSGSLYRDPGAWCMFKYCSNLKYVDLSGFASGLNSSGEVVEANFDMEEMFYWCFNLEAVNFSRFNPEVAEGKVYQSRQQIFGINDGANYDDKLTHVCMSSQALMTNFYKSAYGTYSSTSIKSHEFPNGICLGCGNCQGVVENGHHNMQNGVCTYCGYGGSHSYQMSASVTLKANLSMNLAFYLPDEIVNDAGAYVLVTLPGRTVQLFVKESAEVMINKKTWRSVSYELAAKEMADEASVKVYNGNNQVVYEPSATVSVKSYGESLLNDSSYTTRQKNMVRAMLNYGAYAQKHFKYNTDNLANSSCAQTPSSAQTILNATGDYALVVQDNGANGVNCAGCSLLLEDAVKVRYWFTFDSSLSTAQRNALINSMQLTKSGSKYYYESAPRTVLYWGYTNIYGTGNYHIEYSVVSYIRDVLTMKQSGSLVNLVRSMYDYWKAAEDYATEY